MSIISQDLFTDNEVMALKLFNNTCISIRGDYSKDAIGLFKIWQETLTIYADEFQENIMNYLLSALLKCKPHWSEYIDSFDNIFEKILMYFYRCCKALVPLADGHYAQNQLASYQSTSHTNLNSGYCLLHPNRKSRTDKPVCDLCYSKLKRLELTEYPLDYGLLYVLKIRKKKNKSIIYCVNHPKIIALGNKLCARCNFNLGNLEEELLKSNISMSVFDKL